MQTCEACGAEYADGAPHKAFCEAEVCPECLESVDECICDEEPDLVIDGSW